MLRAIQKQLAPVRSRLMLRRSVPALTRALLLAGWVGVVCGLLGLFGAEMTSAYVGVVIIVLLPATALILVLLRPASWQQAARAVDRHFGLHDRVGTALYLAERSSPEPLDTLQIEDALARLQEVKATEAAALQLDWQRLIGGILVCSFALLLIGWAIASPPQYAPRGGETVDIEAPHDDVKHTPEMAASVDPALVLRSVELSSRESAGRAMTPASVTNGDLADRYFDARQSQRSKATTQP